MNQIKRQDSVSDLRALLFPFFDPPEIAFVFGILALEIFFLWVLSVPNGWVIPIGSYAGMVAVGWISLPSTVAITASNAPIIVAFLQARMIEELPGRFVPKLPWFLRWPRNAIILHNEPLRLSGPRILLDGVKRDMNLGDE